MAAEYKKTAKDIAFDRERQRLNHRINEQRKEIQQMKFDLEVSKLTVDNLKYINRELSKENEMLQTMTNIPKEDLERFLKETHEKSERKKAADDMSALFRIILSEMEDV